jgi:membrane peptidoglycan carboxypeptidase
VPYPTPGNPNDYWTVQNAEPALGGVLPLSSALEQSVNAVYARLAIDIGASNVANMAYELGIPRSDDLPESPSVILGAGSVSPLDMTHAYSTIAATGVRRPLLAVTKVAPYGQKPIRTPASKNKGHRVMQDGAPWELTKFLDVNVHSCCTGTSANVELSGLPYRAQAGKTGTTDDHTDAWFCGYTPNLAACVWVGYPQGEIPMLNLGGTIPGPAFGGGYPATIWREFAAAAFTGEPAKFPATPWALAPLHPVQFLPFTSQFQVPVITPTTKKGGKSGSTGTGSTGTGTGTGTDTTGTGTTGTGTTGTGTTTAPPPPPTT